MLGVNNLMTIRNRVAKVSGLKDVGELSAASGKPASHYGVGDRLGIFNGRLFSRSAKHQSGNLRSSALMTASIFERT